MFVLSDSNDSDVARARTRRLGRPAQRLAANPQQPQVQVYYHLRKRRTHRKAGNVVDFCRRWGKGLPLHGGAGRRQRDERRLHRLHG